MVHEAGNTHPTDMDTVDLWKYINTSQNSSYEHLHSLMLIEPKKERGGPIMREIKRFHKLKEKYQMTIV